MKAKDAEQIKDENPIMAVAARLGLELKRSGSSYRCRCPFHNGDSDSMAVYPSKNIFVCYNGACDAKGDTIALVMKMQGMDFKQALEWLDSSAFEQPHHYTLKPRRSDRRKVERIRQRVREACRHRSAAIPYWTKRGIKPETLAKFDIGVWEGYKMRNGAYTTLSGLSIPHIAVNRITVPWKSRGVPYAVKLRLDYERSLEMLEALPHDWVTEIANDLAARGKPSTDRDVLDAITGGRYLSQGSFSNRIFNADILWSQSPNGRRVYHHYDYVIAAEGEPDVLTLDQEGYPAIGCKGSRYAEIAFQNVAKLIIWRDRDEAGMKYAERILKDANRELGYDAFVITAPQGYKDPNEFYKSGSFKRWLDFQIQIALGA